MVILIVEHQKLVEHSTQDGVSHPIQFEAVQSNTQSHHSIYKMSIIEAIRIHMQSGNDEESQLYTSLYTSEAVMQEGKQDEEIGVPGGVGEGTVDT